MTKSTLTNDQILLHPSFRNLINDENKYIFKNWMVPQKYVDIVSNPNGMIAWTDNVRLTINVMSDIFKEASREEAFLYLYGLTFHEIGHVLFTSYTGLHNYMTNFFVGRLWPSNPYVEDTKHKENLDEMLEYISDPVKAKYLAELTKFLSNAIEDPRIEYFLMAYCEHCPKHKAGLEATQEYLYSKMRSLPELRADENHCDATILNQIMFNYARYGEVAGYDEHEDEYKDDELYNYLLDVIDYIDEAVRSDNSADFFNCINNILVRCWPVYKEFLDEIENGQGSGPSEPNEETDDVTGTIKKILSDNLEGASASHEEEEERAASEGTDKKETSEKINSMDLPNDDDSSGTPPSIDDIEMDSLGGKDSRETEYYDKEGAKIDLSALINRIAKEEADKELENRTISELEDKAKNINYNSINSNVSIELRRPKITSRMKEEYNSYAIQELVRIGKEAAKKILKTIPTEREPIILKNKVIGSKFDASAVARNDLKYFSKKSKPEQGPSLSIGLVVDESGSMSWEGREEAAKAAAIALYSCAETLEVPITIYGHTANEKRDEVYYDVNLIDYADFSKPDPNDKYRLMNIRARSNNRDGVAIQFVAERLLNTDTDKKLLIVISDGRPAAYGYGGLTAEKDMQQIIKKYSKAGVGIIAAAIGSDKENIQQIYSAERFLDITDLSALPRELLKIVKRNMR